MNQRIERAAIAVCLVFYPEAFARGQTWEEFPESTRVEMRKAANAVADTLVSPERLPLTATIHSIRYQAGEMLLQVDGEVPQSWDAGDQVQLCLDGVPQ